MSRTARARGRQQVYWWVWLGGSVMKHTFLFRSILPLRSTRYRHVPTSFTTAQMEEQARNERFNVSPRVFFLFFFFLFFSLDLRYLHDVTCFHHSCKKKNVFQVIEWNARIEILFTLLHRQNIGNLRVLLLCESKHNGQTVWKLCIPDGRHYSFRRHPFHSHTLPTVVLVNELRQYTYISWYWQHFARGINANTHVLTQRSFLFFFFSFCNETWKFF